jgi:hypothetical protein
MMGNALFSGLLAGLAAGIVLGLLLTAVVPSDTGLPERSVMELLTGALGAKHLAPAWGVTLVVSALLGAIFSALVRRAADAGAVSSVALLSALVLWAIMAAVMATIVAPRLVGTRPAVGLTAFRVWPLVVGALMLNLLFWSAVGAVFLWHRRPREGAEVTAARDLRRAA